MTAEQEARRLDPDLVVALPPPVLKPQEHVERLGDPALALLQHGLGDALLARGRHVDARAAYLEALRLDPEPGRAATHLQIGVSLKQEGQLDEALPWLERTVALAPEQLAGWDQLAQLQSERDEPGEAIRCWERVRALELAERAATRIALGMAYQEEGRLDEAEAHYEQAARIEPGSAAALIHLGSVHAEAGRMAEAEAAFRAAARLRPRAAPPLARLATLLRDKLPEADRAAVEDLLADPRLEPGPRARLLFGLAHVLDARGDYDRAADCLRRANALTLESTPAARTYNPDDHARYVEGLLGAFDAAFFARVAGLGLETRRPVFVFGLPRSGTTLVEQVLASHPRVYGCGELRLGRRSFEGIPAAVGRRGRARPVECVAQLDAGSLRRLAEEHLAQLEAREGGRAGWHEKQWKMRNGEWRMVNEKHKQVVRVVDKMPDNTLYLGLLAALFPRGTFIHCRRDLRDVAVSCWMTDFRTIRWANHPAHIAGRFREYRRLMDHWRAVLPVPLHKVDYEETVSDLEGVARRLLAACGLEWDSACLEFHRTPRVVRTASLTQVRQPIYTSSVARWKHYEGALEALFEGLPQE